MLRIRNDGGCGCGISMGDKKKSMKWDDGKRKKKSMKKSSKRRSKRVKRHDGGCGDYEDNGYKKRSKRSKKTKRSKKRHDGGCSMCKDNMPAYYL